MAVFFDAPSRAHSLCVAYYGDSGNDQVVSLRYFSENPAPVLVIR